MKKMYLGKAYAYVLTVVLLMVSLSSKAITSDYVSDPDDNNVIWYFNLDNGKAVIVGWDAEMSTGDMVIPARVYTNGLTENYEVSLVTRTGMMPDDVVNSPVLTFSIEAGSQALLSNGLMVNNGTLNDVDLTNYVGTVIPGSLFRGCGSLRNVKINPSCREVGAYAFQACVALESIDFSQTALTTINTVAFEGCSALASVSFPSTLATIGAIAFRYSGLKSVDLSNTQVTAIPSECFLGCQYLTSVKFNNILYNIGGSAFRYTPLTEVVIPKSVGNISDLAFRDCSQLTKVVFENTVPPVFATNTFYNTALSPKLYVPVDCAQAYKTKLKSAVIGANGGELAINNVREQIKISKYGYNSYYLANENFLVPNGATAYVVTGSQRLADGKRHAVVETFPSGKAVPKAQGFILAATASAGQVLDYEAAVTSNEQALVNDNLMKGTAVGQTFSGGDSVCYVLSPDPDDLSIIGFFYQLGTTGESMTLKAHQAGLFLPKGMASLSKRFLFDFLQTTGISRNALSTQSDKAEGCYDLQGRRVQKPTNGIYIINGKKVIINKK